MEFREEHWNDALKTLRREERKAFLKRWAPWLGLVLLLIGGASGYALVQHNNAPVAQNALLPPKEILTGTPYTASPESDHFEQTNLDEQSDQASHTNQPQEGLAQNAANSGTTQLRAPLPQTATPSSRLPSTSPQRSAAGTLPSTATPPQPSRATSTPPASPLTSVGRTSTGLPNTASAGHPAPSQTGGEGTNPGPQLPAHTVAPFAIAGSTTSSVNPSNGDTGVTLGSTPGNAGELRGAVMQQGQRIAWGPLKPMLALRTPSFSQTWKRGISPSKHHLNTLEYTWKAPGLFGWAGNSFKTGFGSRTNDLRFNPELGVGYRWVAPDPHFAFELGLSYFSIGGIVHAAAFDQQEAGFGLTTTRTTIQTETLHFAQIPALIHYNPGRRVSVNAGVGISYLVNSLSEVVVSQFDHQNTDELDRFESWGYLGGYKTLNASLHFGAEYQVLPKLWLGAQYQYGLTRITKASIYGVNKQDRNSRLRITLKKDLR